MTGAERVGRFQAWYRSAKARALLADCAANPPRQVLAIGSLGRIGAGPDYELRYSDSDDRVDELVRLSNAAFLEAEASGADMRAYVRRSPTIDQLIDRTSRAYAAKHLEGGEK